MLHARKWLNSSNYRGNFFVGYQTIFSKKFFNNIGKKPTCSYCGMPSHTIDKCYKKHRYSSRYRNFNRGYGGSINQVKSKNSSYKNLIIAKGKQVYVEELKDDSSKLMFIKDQYNQLLAFIQSNS